MQRIGYILVGAVLSIFLPLVAGVVDSQRQFFCELGITGYCININSNQVGQGNVAFQVTSKNTDDSAAYITGVPQGRAVMKVALDNPSGNDNRNAAVANFWLKGDNNNGQGLLIDCGKSTGKAINILGDKPEGRKQLLYIGCDGTLHLPQGSQIKFDLVP